MSENDPPESRGEDESGSQRYRGMHCGHKYTPEPKQQGYPENVLKRAMEMYVAGNNLRRIARHLKVAPQTIAYWVTEGGGSLAEGADARGRPGSGNGRTLQFHWGEKNQIYILTAVDRRTRCILGWAVVWTRTQEALQHVVDQAPKAKRYYSDAFDLYQWLWYHWGRYEVSPGKADTYSVETDNAELRHYLARFARRSRCFSRCPLALERALRLFVFCFNSRQLHKQRFPTYPAHLMDFVSPQL